MTDELNAMLMGGGGRSAKLSAVGDKVSGEIVSIDARQQTDFKTGQPLVWDDGNPRMQLVIGLATQEHDDDTDDGVRNLFVKIPSDLRTAIAKAVREVGQNGIATGGSLVVQFYAEEPATRKNMNPTKLHKARYAPPVTRMDDDDPGPELLPF